MAEEENIEAVRDETSSRDKLPVELRVFYDNLYKKIEELIGGRPSFDIKSDLTTMRRIIQSAMTIMAKFKGREEGQYSGEECRIQALNIARFVIEDLKAKGKLNEESADAVLLELDFWGSLAMTLVIDTMKKAIDFGQDVAEDIKENGCQGCCKRNCSIL